MTRRHCVLIAIVLFGLLASPLMAAAAARTQSPAITVSVSAPGDGIVRAVLFWLTTCGHCHDVIEQHLPPLQQKHGQKLVIKLVELSDPRAADVFERAVALYNIPPAQAGVPLLIIGDRVLVGSRQIPLELPGLVEIHLAAGGVAYPAIPGLDSVGSAQGSTVTQLNSGLALAGIIMALLAAALAYAIIGAVMLWRGRALPEGPQWFSLATPALCVAGIIVALYLSYVEVTATTAICGPVGDCNAVQSSSYARLFGVIPVGLVGLAGYLALVVAWAWGRLREDRLAALAPVAIFGMALFGVLFSIYLTYIEIFVLEAVCAWCLASAVIMALLLAINVGPALNSAEWED